MTCCKLSENDTVRDFILNSQAPIYTAIKLTEMYREEAIRLKDKSQDFIEIAEYCEVIVFCCPLGSFLLALMVGTPRITYFMF